MFVYHFREIFHSIGDNQFIKSNNNVNYPSGSISSYRGDTRSIKLCKIWTGTLTILRLYFALIIYRKVDLVQAEIERDSGFYKVTICVVHVLTRQAPAEGLSESDPKIFMGKN